MVESLISSVLWFSASVFWIGLVALITLIVVGWRKHSRWSFVFAAALLVPLAFFLVFSPVGESIGEAAYWIVVFTIWPSILASAALAVAGIVTKEPRLLCVSAILSIPFSFYLFLYPGGRVFVFIPILLLFLAAVMYRLAQSKQIKTITR